MEVLQNDLLMVQRWSVYYFVLGFVPETFTPILAEVRRWRWSPSPVWARDGPAQERVLETRPLVPTYIWRYRSKASRTRTLEGAYMFRFHPLSLSLPRRYLISSSGVGNNQASSKLLREGVPGR